MSEAGLNRKPCDDAGRIESTGNLKDGDCLMKIQKPQGDVDEITLDEIGIIEGTNKSTLRMDYLRYYQDIFQPYRELPINILELGVQTGASLRTWECYFNNANIVGVDIMESARKHATDRCRIEIGSQVDGDFLSKIVAAHPPTIIIDDASHRADYTITTLETLFPALEPGGCYIVEDLFLHFGDSAAHWRGEAVENPITYFHRLLSELLSRAVNGLPTAQTPFVDLVDRFLIVPGAIILWKRTQDLDLELKIDRVRELVERSNIGVNWVYLATYIMKSGGPPKQAEDAARNAVSIEPITRSYRALSQALQLQDDLAGATEAMECALNAARTQHEKDVVTRILAGLRRRIERASLDGSS